MKYTNKLISILKKHQRTSFRWLIINMVFIILTLYMWVFLEYVTLAGKIFMGVFILGAIINTIVIYTTDFRIKTIKENQRELEREIDDNEEARKALDDIK